MSMTQDAPRSGSFRNLWKHDGQASPRRAQHHGWQRLLLAAGIAVGLLCAIEPAIAGTKKTKKTDHIGTSARKTGARPCYMLPNSKVKPNYLLDTWTFSELCQAYNFPTNISATNGNPSGIIGILEFGGGWTAADITQFCKLNKLPTTFNIINVSVDGVTNNNPGTAQNPNGDDYEVNLDIQAVLATYYYCTGKMPTIYMFFSNPADFNAQPWQLSTSEAFIKTFQMANTYKCDTLSISWALNEDYWQYVVPRQGGSASAFPSAIQAIDTGAQAATAAGTAIFAASGDNGSGCSGINSGYLLSPGKYELYVPASCPHVVSCGGTSKSASTEIVWGTSGYYYYDAYGYNPVTGNVGYYNYTGAGTGGGFSTVFTTPSYQTGLIPAPPSTGLPNPLNLTSHRMIPDISADADPNTGVEIVVYGSELQIGGTSGVAPMYAGLFAALKKQPGFILPTLWSKSNYSTANTTAFELMVSGSNGFYNASASGPCPCTGMGVPNGTVIGKLFGVTPPPPSLVTASFSNGVLTITGDNNNNEVNVTYTPQKIAGSIEGGTVSIAPLNANTTVKVGSTTYSYPNAASISVGASRFSVTANPGNGNDMLNFNSLYSTTVTVNLGSGTNTVGFNYCSITTELFVNGGSGVDTVTFVGNAIYKQALTNVNP